MKLYFIFLWMWLSQITSILGQNCSDVCLMWGNHTWQGVVANNASGQWRAVCDDKWDHDDAMVVCRHLGYNAKHAEALEGVQFADVAAGTTVWLDDVECLGTEASLTACEAYSQDHDCISGKYARVSCPTFTGIRLVGGSGAWSGRVEVQVMGGEWGSVCDDHWDDQDATVVCRQLGYNDTNVTATRNATHGQGSGGPENIMLDNMQCEGTESFLWDCPGITNGLHNCRHSEDAGVDCGGAENGEASALSLRDSHSLMSWVAWLCAVVMVVV